MKVKVYSYVIKISIISVIVSIISNNSTRYQLIILKDRPKLHYLLTKELMSCVPEVKMLSNRVFLLPQSSDTCMIVIYFQIFDCKFSYLRTLLIYFI